MTSQTAEAPGLPILSLSALPGGTWSLVNPVGLRCAGLPMRLLSALSTGHASTTDAGPDHAQGLIARCSAALRVAVRDTRFEEALAWQNPGAVATARSYAATTQTAARNARLRDREIRLVRYLTRYTTKTETIGFFGPLAYVHVVDTPTEVVQHPAWPLVTRRLTVMEPWAAQELGRTIAALPQASPWLRIRRRANLPVHVNPGPHTPLELQLLRACDGTVTAAEAIRNAIEGSAWTPAEAWSAFDTLHGRGLLIATWNVPLGVAAARDLGAAVAAVPDPAVRAALAAPLDRFNAYLLALHDASGDADAVVAALDRLGETFHQLTGRAAVRRHGQMYARRQVAFQDTLRSGTVTIGSLGLAPLTEPLEALLTIARWITWATAEAYRRHLTDEWRERGGQSLGGVWPQVMRAFYGSRRPLETVLADLRRRWCLLTAADDAQPTHHEGADFLRRARALFDAPAPGWSGAAFHSPDLQMSTRHTGSGHRTHYVLSELHIAAPTLQGSIFEWPYPDEDLTHLVHRITGPQYVPAYPSSWPRSTGRVSPARSLPGDTTFAFIDVEGLPPDAVSVADILIDPGSTDGPRLVLPDGRVVPMEEFFASFLRTLVVDAFKELDHRPHAPRLTVGDLVVQRETWRLMLDDPAFTTTQDEADALVALEQWARRHGLPAVVYVSINVETKPVFVDFTMPLTVLALRRSVRAALKTGRATRTMKVTEALPAPHDTWLRDPHDDDYAAELRMMLLDPLARPGGNPDLAHATGSPPPP